MDNPPPDVADRVLRGTLGMAGLRLFSRLLGFLAIGIKARVLTRADFGMMGSAALVNGLVGILGTHNVYEQLVRLPVMTEEDLHRGWTVNLLFSLLMAAVVLLLADIAALTLGEPLLADVLRWTALSFVITGLKSPVGVIWARALRFRPEILYRMATRSIEVVCTTGGAVLLRSYWGLVYGGLVAGAITLILSYVILPFRPRPTLRGAGGLLAFSGWSMLYAVANYFAQSADELVVRRAESTERFGLYHVSRDMSRIFVSEAVMPASGPLLAGLARLQQGGEERRRLATLKALGAAALVAAAVGFGLAATAAEAIRICLGPDWSEAGPLLALIAPGVAAQAVAELHRSMTVAFGMVQVSTALWGVRAVAQLGTCSAAQALDGLQAVALVYTVTSAALMLFDYSIVFRLLGSARLAVDALWRPVLAGAAMFAVLRLLPWPASLPVVPLALAKIASGAAMYPVLVLSLWRLSGRPQGGESILLDRLPGRLGGFARRIVGQPARSGASSGSAV